MLPKRKIKTCKTVLDRFQKNWQHTPYARTKSTFSSSGFFSTIRAELSTAQMYISIALAYSSYSLPADFLFVNVQSNYFFYTLIISNHCYTIFNSFEKSIQGDF